MVAIAFVISDVSLARPGCPPSISKVTSRRKNCFLSLQRDGTFKLVVEVLLLCISKANLYYILYTPLPN